MKKSDKSIHNVTIAAIKRSTMKPYDFKWTQFYESNSDFYYKGLINFLKDELIICSTIISSDNYSIVTTQRLLTCEKGIEQIANLTNAKNKSFGNFKGYENELITFGMVELPEGNTFKYFIETGKASMIMIHGVKTLIRIQKYTIKNTEKLN
ncbi:hypothetical protein [Tenacibaculum sp. M341]|uniref:hypothetical protein n=1 Tax=Tenacibaculum sp. M341 TaxID=2530339 RepID=UPI0010530EC3|nr:hypothetical protein [Tenacibaculum sp. M341]TCI90627.1 hypothetical protein EYW44_12955 [Tenacibaculum sp. M341]